MPVLLIPLLLLALVVLLLALVPLGVWQRYRLGKARRRALPWLVRLNGWLLLVSTAMFLTGAWIGSHWIEHALAFAAIGVLAGLGLGAVGIAITRFERQPGGVHYTPNRWLVLLLTVLVVARIAVGLWQATRAPADAVATSTFAALIADHGSLFAVGGIVLGHALAYTWCLRWRLAPVRRRRR